MSAVASKPPFPIAEQHSHWLLPAMLAPSLYLMAAFAYLSASGNGLLCSPTLLFLVGLGSIYFGGREILRSSGPRHRQICQFVAVLFLVYLQLLLPRLWGLPS